ncbi:carbohydrate ABC transporter permease, partial [Eisenbergiella sp. OF01-20]|uniref:carbohydrate ABC transporter permease n=2 Tax=Lachnospiraceae TaxID=186803 RepID=UPI000FEE5EA5
MPVSKGEKIFNVINSIFLVAVALFCLAPMVYMLAVSLSDNAQVVAGNVTFWPKKFTTATYEYLLGYQAFWKSMGISVVRTALSLVFTLTLTVLSAYPLSKSPKKFYGRSIFAWYFFIPMLINGGLIPTYMIVSRLGLIGSLWALILPSAVTVFYVMLLLNFFRGLPEELEEAALLDGAGQWTILFRVFLPLATPALATIAVYCSLAQWNEWFNGIIYMKTPSQYPLMSYLQATVLNVDMESLSAEEQQKMASIGSDTYQAAQLFIAALPMLCIYPFMQKYFTKG